ncbi:MAG: AAA family ATPase [Dermatophilaceae bacterium]
MRLHRLEVEAFGPFAERVTVDLDALSAAGLFLVHGPTGSGKTSLLDAVCFAVYADVPGARSRRGLRSDHAAPDQAPQVRLDLTLGGRRLRFTRSPEWQRPKRRGDGTRRVQPAALLEERRSGHWSPISTRHDEIALVVDDLLGMGLRQFAQVVLLPQGEFAAFLRATPDERRIVLENLFDVSEFAAVEQWLTDARRDAAVGAEQARSALAADLARIEDVLADLAADDEPTDLDGPALSELSVGDVPGRVGEIVGMLDARLAGSLVELDAADGADRLAHDALVEATRLVDLRRRAERSVMRLAELDAGEAEHLRRLAALDAAARAATLTGHLDAVRRAAHDAAGRASAVATQHARLDILGVDLGGAAPGSLARGVHDLDEVVRALTAAARTHQEVAGRLADAMQRREAAHAAVATASTEVDRLAPEVDRALREQQLVTAAGERIPGLELAHAGQQERLRMLDDLDNDFATVSALGPLRLRGGDTVLVRQAELIALRQRRLDGLAAELAARLDTGRPCPVCGSAEHPRPARSTDVVSAEEIVQAEQALDAARAELARIDSRLAAAGSAAEARRQALGGAARDAVERDHAAASTALVAARDQARRSAEVQEQLRQLTTRADHHRAARGRAVAEAEVLDTVVAELTVEAAEAARLTAQATKRHASCLCGSADPARHLDAAAALDLLVRAADDADAAASRAAAAQADLAAAMDAAGFTDPDEAEAAVLSAVDVARIRALTTEHDEARVTASAVLDDPEVVTALAAAPPHLDEAERLARSTRRAAVEAATRREMLTRALGVLHRLRPRLDAGCRRLHHLEERHAQVREIAEVAAGTSPDNTLKMRLTAFVLAARLEKVVVLANERLQMMGEGRYLLEHTDARAARGARSGLGIQVLDQWTGRVRETASLSGGESFVASLALALGLADAVREESGGLDLGTLFVDEGFGSLDDASLDQVITVLDGLREGGRSVGVVSHVADLRDRVSHQAVVVKTATGSTVQVRVGAEPAA